jgi:2-C-methyl-D-erythritol 4-phosphate cytidylyltransferase
MEVRVTAIVPSAGIGKRFGSLGTKPFVEIRGLPVVIHILKKLHEIKVIKEIIPVFREQDMERGLEIIERHKLKKIRRIARGGKERQDSIYNALKLIKDEDCIVLIHDGVRPLVSRELIERLINEVGDDGVVPGLPVNETLKEVDTRGFALSTIKRDRVWTIQTPQVFPFKVIKRAYEEAFKDGFYATDDAALVERIGGKVKVIRGSVFNIKITTPDDIEIIESLLSRLPCKY